MVQEGIERADAVVAPTQWMLQQLTDFYALPAKNLVIANGREIPFSKSTQRLQAASLGRLWDPAKGLSVLSELSLPIPVYVAGEKELGSQRSMPALTNVRQLGVLAEDDVFSLFRGSALYLCTSIYEPFGLAPLEAALCGCGIIARDVASLREVWADNAMYFSDALSLSEILEQLLELPEALNSLQLHSSLRAQQFTREKMTSRYLNLYRNLLNRREEISYVA
jgi:glycosyltransferase involved in cell wall biosynthesis